MTRRALLAVEVWSTRKVLCHGDRPVPGGLSRPSTGPGGAAHCGASAGQGDCGTRPESACRVGAGRSGCRSVPVGDPTSREAPEVSCGVPRQGCRKAWVLFRQSVALDSVPPCDSAAGRGMPGGDGGVPARLPRHRGLEPIHETAGGTKPQPAAGCSPATLGAQGHGRRVFRGSGVRCARWWGNEGAEMTTNRGGNDMSGGVAGAHLAGTGGNAAG